MIATALVPIITNPTSQTQYHILASHSRVTFSRHIPNIIGYLRRDTEQSETEKQTLWRERGPIGKIHNLVIHITRSPRRKDLFNKYQQENIFITDNDKIYSLVRDGGVRWNSTYLMINRAFQLRDSMDQYCYMLGRCWYKSYDLYPLYS